MQLRGLCETLVQEGLEALQEEDVEAEFLGTEEELLPEVGGLGVERRRA